MNSHSQSNGTIQMETPMPVLERHAGCSEYPLSLNQQHMWFQAQLDSESSLWNLGAKMSVTGPLDIAMFIQAIQNTVDRHEILRTIFTVIDDVPVQQVMDVKVECTDEGITIEGEKKREQESNEGGWHRTERSYGHFYRMIPLPEGAQAEKAQAEFRDGVLQVRVPLSQEKRKSRQIPISESRA